MNVIKLESELNIAKKEVFVRDGLLLLTIIFSGYFIFFKLNPLQIDQPGHLVSAVLFMKGHFHNYVDNFFGGWVHGLFYPPLEDMLLSLFFISPFHTKPEDMVFHIPSKYWLS